MPEVGKLKDSLDTGSDRGIPSGQDLEGGPGLEKEVEGTEIQPGVTPSPFTPEYKSHEEAERAVKEGKRALSKANEEKSRLYKMLQRLEKPPVTEGRRDTPQKRIVREALIEIDRISAEDPDRADKIAEIWADANEKIADLRVSSRFQEHTNLQEGIRYAEEKAKQSFAKIGIKPNSKAAEIALKIFWGIAPTAPAMDFEEQLDWTINEISTGINELRAGDKERNVEEEKETEGLRGVIGKGGRIPSEKKETKAERFSLGDLQKELEKERIVK